MSSNQETLSRLQRIRGNSMELKEAIKNLIDLGIEDFVYTIRDNVDFDDLEDGESSWDHPDVVRYGDSVEVLKKSLVGQPTEE